MKNKRMFAIAVAAMMAVTMNGCAGCGNKANTTVAPIPTEAPVVTEPVTIPTEEPVATPEPTPTAEPTATPTSEPVEEITTTPEPTMEITSTPEPTPIRYDENGREIPEPHIIVTEEYKEQVEKEISEVYAKLEAEGESEYVLNQVRNAKPEQYIDTYFDTSLGEDAYVEVYYGRNGNKEYHIYNSDKMFVPAIEPAIIYDTEVPELIVSVKVGPDAVLELYNNHCGYLKGTGATDKFPVPTADGNLRQRVDNARREAVAWGWFKPVNVYNKKTGESEMYHGEDELNSFIKSIKTIYVDSTITTIDDMMFPIGTWNVEIIRK